MSRHCTVRVTENFTRNLDDIRKFLEEQEAPQAFDQLLTQIFDRVIPNLESFPEMGIDFLARRPMSTEGMARWSALKRRLGVAMLREYITGDYLVLYAISKDQFYLLSIKHHRQLSYDLRVRWV
jgi:plasmid stabilization system protein ParE